MPIDRCHGECLCPNSILPCQICMVKLVKVMNELCFRLLGMRNLTARLSLNCHRVGPFSLMAETDKPQTPLVVTPCHPIILWGPDCTCIMLNISLLLPFICGYLPPLSAHPVSYWTVGGHGRNPSPLGVKCAEQTDPRITQRLDTLAGYLRAESS